MARRRTQLQLIGASVQVITTPAQMRTWSREHRSTGARIGFVPTMGALHAGHAALMQRARTENDLVVLSIFVNPAQFNVAADFDKYPRDMDADLAVARNAGVDAVYAPTVDVVYPEGHSVMVEPGTAAIPMEGAGRPGHFRGVTTVVAKLFNTVEPDVAYFGRKDYQQLAVVNQMVRDLDMGVTVVGVDTVREEDGLALSSRNVRLSPAHRAQAPVIKRALDAIVAAVADGERSVDQLRAHALDVVSHAQDCSMEYIEIADVDTLAPLDTIGDRAVVCVAAWFGDVRLIDNVTVVAR